MHYTTIVFGLLTLTSVANSIPIDETHQNLDVTTIPVASSLQARVPTSTKAGSTTGKSTTTPTSGTAKATSGAASNTSANPSSAVSSAAGASSSSASPTGSNMGTNSKGNSTATGGTDLKGNSTAPGGTNSTGNSTAPGGTNLKGNSTTSGNSTSKGNSTAPGSKPGNSTSCPVPRAADQYDVEDKYIIIYKGSDIGKLAKKIQSYAPPRGKCLEMETGEPLYLISREGKGYQIYIGYLDKLIVKDVLDPLKKSKKLTYSTPRYVFPEEDPTVVDENAGWHLARISQEPRLQNLGLLNGRVGSQDWKYPHKANWGSGVLIYVVDTGVQWTHTEFAGRIDPGHMLENGQATDAATTDSHGHGTGVASVAAGRTVGVARQATIVPVKISDSEMGVDTTHLLQALDWIKSDIAYNRGGVGTKAVVNISWEFVRTDAAQLVLQILVDFMQAHVVVSAGNERRNDCRRRISNEKLVAMVGGIDWKDKDVYNYGPCVNMHAPAKSIYMARHDVPDNGFKYDQGTSYAAPQVAGVIASELTTQDLTPAQMRTLLESERFTPGITNIRDQTPDRILLTRLAKEPGNAIQ